MNQIIITEELKFYSLKSISIAAFLGGPLAAAFLIRRNYLNQGDDESALISIILGVLSTALIFGVFLTIPETVLDMVPNYIYPTIIAAIVHFIANKYQGQTLKEHEKNSGNFFSAWKAAGVGLIFTILMLFCLLVVIVTDIVYEFDVGSFEGKIEEIPDETVQKMNNSVWDDGMKKHGVFVLFDREYLYVFDLYFIPIYDKKIPFDYFVKEDVMSIEIIHPITNDYRINNLGIDTRRSVIFMKLETISEELKNSSYMTKFLKSDILE